VAVHFFTTNFSAICLLSYNAGARRGRRSRWNQSPQIAVWWEARPLTRRGSQINRLLTLPAESDQQ